MITSVMNKEKNKHFKNKNFVGIPKEETMDRLARKILESLLKNASYNDPNA